MAAVRRAVDSTRWGQPPRCIHMETLETACCCFASAAAAEVVAVVVVVAAASAARDGDEASGVEG